jgi:hypothetical protein
MVSSFHSLKKETMDHNTSFTCHSLFLSLTSKRPRTITHSLHVTVSSFHSLKRKKETVTCKGCVMVRGLFYGSERKRVTCKGYVMVHGLF